MVVSKKAYHISSVNMKFSILLLVHLNIPNQICPKLRLRVYNVPNASEHVYTYLQSMKQTGLKGICP